MINHRSLGCSGEEGGNSQRGHRIPTWHMPISTHATWEPRSGITSHVGFLGSPQMKLLAILALTVLSFHSTASAQSATPIPSPVPLATDTGLTEDGAKARAQAALNGKFKRWCDQKCASEGGVKSYRFPDNACTFPAGTWPLSGGGYECQAQIDPRLVICECLGALPPPAPAPRPTSTPKPISNVGLLSDDEVRGIAESLVDLLTTP